MCPSFLAVQRRISPEFNNRGTYSGNLVRTVMNVRSALEYVPYFCGRLFVVHVAAGLLRAEELVDALLDSDALHEVGVRLVLVAEGADAASLAHRAGECEMHAALAELATDIC